MSVPWAREENFPTKSVRDIPKYTKKSSPSPIINGLSKGEDFY